MADDCLFCRIVNGDVPADVVARSDRALAFRDITPQAPTHVLVIPTEHYANADELAHGDAGLAAEVLGLGAQVAQQEGIAASGYRFVFNTGAGAGQTVFHVHLHVLGGRPMGWPPG